MFAQQQHKQKPKNPVSSSGHRQAAPPFPLESLPSYVSSSHISRQAHQVAFPRAQLRLLLLSFAHQLLWLNRVPYEDLLKS